MKGFNISKLITLMAVLAMGYSLAASAQTQIAFRIAADNFVHGVNQNATFKVYVNANAKVKSFVMTFDLATSGGMDFAGTPDGAIKEVNTAFTADANITKTGVSGQSLTFNVKSAVGKYAMEATGGEILIATIDVTIPAAMVGANNLPYMLANSTAFNEVTLGQSPWASVTPAYNAVQQIPISVFTKRTVAAGSLFIQKGAETSKVFTLTSTGGDASKPVTYAITTQPTKGTVTIAGDKATYTVTDTNTEFFDANADSFQFTATDETTGTSTPAKVTVSYRANPPAVITALAGQPAIGSTIAVNEVDGTRANTSFTLGINAADDAIVTPNGVAKIEWAVALGDEANAWTIDVPVANYNPALASQDNQVTITLPGYNTITRSPRPLNKDFTVTVTVTDSLGATSTATWTVKVSDVDRPQGAPQAVTGFTPAAPKTGDDITVAYTGAAAADPDGDAITYRVNWTCGGKTFAGVTLPSANTLKGETWTASVVSVTTPYGADVVSAPVTANIVIGNTAPVVAGGSMFIRKGAETVKTFTLTATDADPADVFTYAVVAAPAKGNVVIAGNVATYTVTDPTQEFFGAAADTFTFVANDGIDNSNVATVTVTYRENPPADIVALAGKPALGGVVDVPEVDANGAPSVFTLGINATDSNIVVPFGVKKIAWAVNGNPAAWTISAPSTDYANVPSQDNTVSITLPGYETIAGVGRPATQDFVVTVTVTDALDVDSTATWTIRVSDVDRPASAPATLDILVDGAAIADGGQARVAQAITLNAVGSVDPDGDAVTGYDFSWANNQNASTDIATRAKGETWTVTAKAKTTVYGTDMISTLSSAKSVVIVNTPPALALVAPLPWTGATALLEDCATTTLPLTGFVTPADNDAADLEAGRSYTVAFTQTDKGSLTYDPTQKTVAFTPALDFNGDVTFTVTANDGTAASLPVNVVFTVLPVNDAPSVAIADFYAIPDDCNEELIEWGPFAINMGGGADEAGQGLLDFALVEIVDPDGILGGFGWIFYNGDQGSRVTINFGLLESAKDKMGSEAIVRFTIQDGGGVDNGGVDTSAVTEFKIVLGATPWYPLYALTDAKLAENPAFAAYTSYVVRIKDGNTVLAQNTLKDGDRVFTPAKYFTSDVACAGLLPSATVGQNKQYTVEILPRDKNGVVNDPAKVLLDTVLVPFYAAPTAASFTNADADGVIAPAGNTVTFDINAPLASTFTLKVYFVLLGAPPRLVFERNGVKFQPRADGMIVPVTTLNAEFLTPGEYVADLSSANPAGASAAVLDTATFTIAAAGQSNLVWPADGFSPVMSLQAAGDTANPQFVWPEIGAAGYTLWVTDALGQAVVNGVAVDGTSYNGATLNAGETYTWWVVALGADGTELRSSALSLAIMNKADTPLVATATKAGVSSLTLAINPDLLPEAGATYYYDLEYVSAATARFYYFKYAIGNTAPFVWVPGNAPTFTANLPGVPVAPGDYVFIRVMDAQGQALSDYILYAVQ